jgi:hypothetical protein
MCPEPVTCRGLRRQKDAGKQRILQVWSCDEHRAGVEYARPLDEDRDRELLRAIIEGGRRAMGPDREPMPSPAAAWQWRRHSPPIMVPGNPAAFSAVVETYRDELIDKAGELLGKSGTEADEAVQKVFDQMLWLMTHLGVAEDLPLAPWLSMWLVDLNPSPEQIAARAAATEEEWLRGIEEGHQLSQESLDRRLGRVPRRGARIMTSESRAIIGFASGAVSGTIEPINAAFGDDNRTFTFSNIGVTYSGQAEASTGTGGTSFGKPMPPRRSAGCRSPQQTTASRCKCSCSKQLLGTSSMSATGMSA